VRDVASGVYIVYTTYVPYTLDMGNMMKLKYNNYYYYYKFSHMRIVHITYVYLLLYWQSVPDDKSTMFRIAVYKLELFKCVG